MSLTYDTLRRCSQLGTTTFHKVLLHGAGFVLTNPHVRFCFESHFQLQLLGHVVASLHVARLNMLQQCLTLVLHDNIKRSGGLLVRTQREREAARAGKPRPVSCQSPGQPPSAALLWTGAGLRRKTPMQNKRVC